MILNIHTANGTQSLCIVGIIIENRAFKFCVCVLVCSSRFVFGQVYVWSESNTIVLLIVTVRTIIHGCAVEWDCSKVVIWFQVRVYKFAKNSIFWSIDSIDDGDSFIIIFEAVDPFVDDRENFHMNSMEQADFCDLKRFWRTVIHVPYAYSMAHSKKRLVCLRSD